MTGRRPRLLALLVACATIALFGGGVAWAWFTDDATMTTGTFEAHIVGQPADAMTCAASGSTSMTVTIPHADDRYTYVVKVYNNAGTTQLGPDFPMTRSGGLWTRTITRADASFVSLFTTYQIRVYARLATNPAWESTEHRAWTFRTTGLSVLLVLFTCVDNLH